MIAKRGINIVLKEGAAPSTSRITLDLKDVPMSEALKYITDLAGMRYKVEPYAIVVVPLSDISVEMYTRTYKVPPDFLRIGGQPNATAKEVLMAQGIAFRPDLVKNVNFGCISSCAMDRIAFCTKSDASIGPMKI